MLTGLMPLTGGDATILGYSVKYEMAKISQIMGVCPQHDVLWANLTGREHLELFGNIYTYVSYYICTHTFSLLIIQHV
jgi:ATP-binding cassette, subfamily A (ABC1), member 3